MIQKVIKNGNRFIVDYTEYDESNEVGLSDIQPKAYYNTNQKNKNYGNKGYNNNNRPAQSANYNNPRRNNND